MGEFVNITCENLEDEHLCCAISDKKHQNGVNLKKEWLRKRIPEGHVFRKLKAQGKVFMEYAPLEKAWCPVNGENFMYIYCLWVAGSFKNNGYGKELLEYAIKDCQKQQKNGICTISSKKKKPFLGEKKFFEKYGFEVVDTIGEYELLALCFGKEKPQFNENAKKMEIERKELTIFYSEQCPFTNHCVKELKEYAEEKGVKISFEKIDTLEKAKNMPCVFNNWANFKEGKFLSNTLLNKNMVEKL